MIERAVDRGRRNVAHRQVGVRAERVFSRMRDYTILGDCHRHDDGLHHASVKEIGSVYSCGEARAGRT